MSYCYKVVSEEGDRLRLGELDRFVCKDGYIHVRLRKYGDRKERVVGFYDKLRFVATMLVQQYAKPLEETRDDASKTLGIWRCFDAIGSAEKGEVMKRISSSLKGFMWNSKFKGVAISPRYCREKNEDLLFSVTGGLVGDSRPSIRHDEYDDSDIADIVDFLIDDGKSIAIEQKTNVDYSKFDRRGKKESVIWLQ